MDNILIDLTGYVPEDYAKSFGFDKVIDLSHIYYIYEMEDFKRARTVIVNRTKDHLMTLRINAKVSVFNDEATNICLLKRHKVVAQALLNMWHESVRRDYRFFYANIQKNHYNEYTQMAFGTNVTKQTEVSFKELVEIK